VAKSNQTKTTSPVAKLDDGTVQVTLTVPWKTIESARKKTAIEMGTEMEVKGFRKGKAPLEKLLETISPEMLTEKTLSKILPELYVEALQKEKITPAMYPKFELVHAHEGEDWQVRAITCVFPEVNLGDYKKTIQEKSTKKGDKPPTIEEKESMVIKTLLDTVKIKVPHMLVEEEANSRLSSLLSRLEKLGLSLENYLASAKKDAATLRSEYEAQAEDAIKLDFALSAVANEADIKVEDREVEEYLKIAGSDNVQNNAQAQERKETIRLFLRKRKSLESLTDLVA